VSRAEGIPAATNFTLVRTELEPLQDREVLVRNLVMPADAFIGLIQGRNIGKMVVELARASALGGSLQIRVAGLYASDAAAGRMEQTSYRRD